MENDEYQYDYQYTLYFNEKVKVKRKSITPFNEEFWKILFNAATSEKFKSKNKNYLFVDNYGILWKPIEKKKCGIYKFENPGDTKYAIRLEKSFTKVVIFEIENDMETKELRVQIPEGFEIDKDKSTFEKIIFKKKDTKPRSWEEYCDNFKGRYYYIQDNRDGIATSFTHKGIISEYKNIFPSKEMAETFLAMMQLMSLRQAWIDDWEPDWSKGTYCVVSTISGIFAAGMVNFTHPLSFPTQEMATDFKDCFKDLLEKAKGLY